MFYVSVIKWNVLYNLHKNKCNHNVTWFPYVGYGFGSLWSHQIATNAIQRRTAASWNINPLVETLSKLTFDQSTLSCYVQRGLSGLKTQAGKLIRKPFTVWIGEIPWKEYFVSGRQLADASCAISIKFCNESWPMTAYFFDTWFCNSE